LIRTARQLDQATLARTAGLVLVLIGMPVLLGSFETWGSCPSTPCGGILMAISEYSGIGLGFGWISALAGLALIAIGIASVVRPGAYDLAGAAGLASVAISAAAVASIVWMYVIPGEDKEFYWPPLTATVIAILGLVGLVASRFLRRSRPQVSGKSPT
jgi:hypothetical protein